MLKAFTKTLFQLPRGPKRAIQIAFDVLAMAFCFWLAMVLRLDGIATTLQPQSWAVLLAPRITVLTWGFFRHQARDMWVTFMSRSLAR